MKNRCNSRPKIRTIFSIGISLIMTSAIVGCATDLRGIDASNFRDRIHVERRDVTLYLGKYIGPEQECFPPIDKRICRVRSNGQPLYQNESKLDMEIFDLSIKFGTSGIDSDVSDELMFLAAAELAMQRSYKMFTPLENSVSLSCSSDDVTSINGQIFSSTYFARSTTSKSTTCAGSKKRQFLFFNDKSALGKGVLEQDHSSEFDTKNAWPLLSLYYGAIPDLSYPTVVSTPSFKYIPNWPVEGWKQHYEADTVSKAMRQKHGVNDQLVYKVKVATQRENALDKLRQSSP